MDIADQFTIPGLPLETEHGNARGKIFFLISRREWRQNYHHLHQFLKTSVYVLVKITEKACNKCNYQIIVCKVAVLPSLFILQRGIQDSQNIQRDFLANQVEWNGKKNPHIMFQMISGLKRCLEQPQSQEKAWLQKETLK